MADNKIDLALKEIGFCPSLSVAIANGLIVKICKGRYPCPEKNGVKKEVEIQEDIVI